MISCFFRGSFIGHHQIIRLTDYVNCSRNCFARLLQIENQRSFDLYFKGTTNRTHILKHKQRGSSRNIHQVCLLYFTENFP